ncbi:MAG TPA: hypothetical protein VF053_11140 [Streptosporangiales bacterium]
MKNVVRCAVAGMLGLAGALLVVGSADASAAHHSSSSAEPVFVQNDNPSDNAVVVYDREPDGTLDQAGTYPTGGLGGVLGGSVIDHLASQGSLTYDRQHELLYAVNAGSDTLTVFAVHGDELRRLQVIGSGGEFPVSITVHGDVLYVLDARGGGSVQGFLRVGTRLVRVPVWHRALGLDASMTPEFTSTPGQVLFTPRGDELIVTTKNNGSRLDVFRVDRAGAPSRHPVVTPDPGRLPFAATFDAAGRLDVAEAGTNTVATFTVGRDGSLTLSGREPTGQQATCWITSTGSAVFADNAASATVSSFMVGSQGLSARGTVGTDAGTADAAATADGRYLYVQAGAAGIVDEFAVGADGALTRIGSVTVPDAAGGEGIAAA